MKELSIEEKAKAYDHALEVIEKYKGANIMFTQDLKEEMFPSLKESEDEKIRKEIIEYIKIGTYRKSWIDWLEKQGEQNPADKVEPKFKVGDWVMLDRPVLITKVEDMPYNTHQYWTSDDTWFGDATKAKLWTIKDAKDGDVLLSPSTPEGDKECPFIFKEIDKNGIVRFHAALLQNEELKIADGITNVMGYANAKYHIPATKEQRDTLMKAMADAGYEWDAEKKELKKIEQKPVNNLKWNELTWDDINTLEGIINNVHYEFRNGIGEESFGKEVLERFRETKGDEYMDEEEQNPVVGIKDDALSDLLHKVMCHYINDTDIAYAERKEVSKKIIPYIETLEKQSEQKSIEWSEEDESMRDNIITGLKMMRDGSSNEAVKAFYDKKITWLKSLKDRVQPQPKQGEQNLVLRDTFGYEDGRLFGMNEGIGLVLDNPEKYGLQKPVKWSKEDENIISLILSICNDFLESFEISPASTKVVKEDVDKIENWIKSLRHQNRWKPSDEQMKALKHAFNDCSIAFADMKILATLYEQLKALHRYEQDT